MSAVDKSYLDMSDEEIANLDPSTVNQAEETVVNTEVVSNDEESSNHESTDDGSSSEEVSEQGQVSDAEKEGLLDAEDEEEEASAADADKESTDKVVEPDSTENKESTEAVDYKAAYEKLFTPFKANGREIAVKSVEDAVALMQMGANYNKKMAALKPNLKLLKLLENNGLLDESKIGYLIDLDKKNPEAINKLVQESGMDPLDLNADKAGDYKPSTYTVDEREMELDAVLDSLQESPAYSKTLNVVSNLWDGASKQVIANSPQLLTVINSHVESGIYDLISKEIESERVFGRLNGLSDIEAYRQVGDAMQARGGFNHIAALNKAAPVATPKEPIIVQPKPKQVDAEKLREKKRAASSTKLVGSNQVKQDYNPLSLSDDAFSKLINDQYL